MKKMLYSLLACGLILFFNSKVYAGSISYDNISTSDIWKITTAETTGNTMTGMAITVTFASGGSPETVLWNDSGLSTGALGTNWSLTMTNYNQSTYPNTLGGGAWNFTSSVDITSIKIDALAGDTVFDVVYDPMDTANSGWGWAISDDKSNYATISGAWNATYSNLIQIMGATTQYSDLYGTLTLNGTSGTSGNILPSTLTFYADTDNTTVPEPISLLLFGTGLIGFAGFRFKKNISF